ncbi:acyltransferase [Neolewinella antarctica]|uniref:Acetyltransferase-like isoleucine patch superfamily enzyme n=1 Tax=Neolewinella antarctica TaxID=442734 RepID=A0ABX0XA25_9BACT|nr:acyltransferase [Neolewinella antarctica]NJC26111.1 acetyltransferase-like isoleucine patch superfamily enzyme [Neolewinella antarctica]
MENIIKKIWQSDAVFSNTFALLNGFLRYKGKLFLTFKMIFTNNGKLCISKGGKLYAGFLSNRLGQHPGTKGIIKISAGGLLQINGHVRIAESARIYIEGSLIIGNGTYVNPNTMIVASSTVKIGDRCAISWDCQILDNDLHDIGESGDMSSPIFIGDDVLIGSRVIILKGVTIGNGCVVAAGSIVTKDLPSRTLCGGIPARVLKENIDWT